jgi:hypothetical protein
MNKAQRHAEKMKWFFRRLKNIRALGRYLEQRPEDNFHALRTSGKPCSCALCDPHKGDPGREKHSTVKRSLSGE